jgi:hypothetical protein
MNSAAVFSPDKDGNATQEELVEAQRKGIKVESVQREENNPDPDKEKDDEDEDKDPDKVKEPENETDEQKVERLAAEKAEKEQRKAERQQRKWDKLAAEKTAAEKRVLELEAQLKEKPKEGLTEEEINRRAEELAAEKLKSKSAEDATTQFQRTADTLIKDAKKIDKDFEKKINEVAEDTGVKMPAYMVDILADLDNKNGHEILAQMAADPDLYEELCGLNERRMIRRLDKMSDEIKTKTKKEKPSNLPDPIEPINDGSNNRGNTIPKDPTKNMDEYVRIRALQVADQRKLGKNIY